jgi:hypothetical protein
LWFVVALLWKACNFKVDFLANMFDGCCFSSAHHVFLADTCHISNLSKLLLSIGVSAASPAAPDLAPDFPADHRDIPADPPNWHSEYQFGELAGMTRRPAGRPGERPGPAGLTAGLAAYIKTSWGGFP